MNMIVRPGIDDLLSHKRGMLEGRIGLVCHAASRAGMGMHTAAALRRHIGSRLVCLFGPEHGVTGRVGAGEAVTHQRHPRWKIPVYSLYGQHKRPTAAMLRDVDTIVYDLQDIGARPYTYVSTLREILEAAAEHHSRVIVTDRPVPLASVVDGPMRHPDFESFVSHVPAPVVYGMTPGEMALWLKKALRLDLDLHVVPCRKYRRQARPDYAWTPPSPAIVSWDSALCFPITVFFEAIPIVDHGRGTATPFQTLATPQLDVVQFAERMNRWDLPGVRFAPCSYEAKAGLYRGRHVQGLRITVTDPRTYHPVHTAVLLIHELQHMFGPALIWRNREARPEFFDKLMGTDRVRRALEKGESPISLFVKWRAEHQKFLRTRAQCLLY